MADVKKVYDDLTIINLYKCIKVICLIFVPPNNQFLSTIFLIWETQAILFELDKFDYFFSLCFSVPGSSKRKFERKMRKVIMVCSMTLKICIKTESEEIIRQSKPHVKTSGISVCLPSQGYINISGVSLTSYLKLL